MTLVGDCGPSRFSTISRTSVQRVNTAESEDGFQWRDNSCFGRFKSMDEFVAYIKNTNSGGGGGSAGSVFVSALNVVLALALALFLLH